MIAAGVHALGDHAPTRSVVTLVQHVGEVLAVLGIVVVVLRTRAEDLVRALGVCLLLLVWLSPTARPWYFLWGVTALAATRSQRGSPWRSSPAGRCSSWDRAARR